MSKWADNTFCEHGINFSTECDRCDIAGIQESLKWMTRRVKRDEARLIELEQKITAEIKAIRESKL